MTEVKFNLLCIGCEVTDDFRLWSDRAVKYMTHNHFDRLRWFLNITIIFFNYKIGHCQHAYNSYVWGILAAGGYEIARADDFCPKKIVCQKSSARAIS